MIRERKPSPQQYKPEKFDEFLDKTRYWPTLTKAIRLYDPSWKLKA
jgi:hypothetical protein